MSGVREARLEAVEESRSGAPSGEPEARREVRGARAARSRWCCVCCTARRWICWRRDRAAGRPVAGWREEFLEARREELKSVTSGARG